ncbi:MAG: hypothetical protein Q8O55_01405 [Dehalococcoidales bacterium]|nr:hypothetical protein [Dehalococcoidales bacterium]
MAGEGSGSKLEDVLRGERGKSTPTDPPALGSALERELAADDDSLAKDLQRSRAEEIIAARQVRIGQMRAHVLGGAREPEVGGVREPARSKEWLTDMAEGLLKRGLDPAVVGRTVDYLLGIGQLPQVGLPGAGTPAQGISFSDMKELFKMGQESNKSDPAIAVILAKLTEKIEALEKRPTVAAAPPQKSFIVVKADGSVQEIESGKPIFLEPRENPDKTDSIEVVKEKNRHAEEMQRLDTEKVYKASVAKTLADIPEKIGRGIAGHMADEGEELEAVSKTFETEHFKCETTECGREFEVEKGATRIQCPFCQSVYTRSKKD